MKNGLTHLAKMNFDTFTVVNFPPIDREVPNFVYILFAVTESTQIPFYVGQTSRLWGRLDDYYWAQFSASTDFRIGEAIRHLGTKAHRVVVKYKHSEEPRREEAEIIKGLLAEGFTLLNTLRGFDYRKSDESEERSRIQRFVEKLLSSPSV
ncbi:MAG TPA: hypothetical protein VGN17_29565 [Bryobacteraceae bacterium]